MSTEDRSKIQREADWVMDHVIVTTEAGAENPTAPMRIGRQMVETTVPVVHDAATMVSFSKRLGELASDIFEDLEMTQDAFGDADGLMQNWLDQGNQERMDAWDDAKGELDGFVHPEDMPEEDSFRSRNAFELELERWLNDGVEKIKELWSNATEAG